MNVINLKYNIELFEKKNELEEQFCFVSREIERIQNNCDHVRVALGYNGYSCFGASEVGQCLFCRKSLKQGTTTKNIYATTYMRGKYGEGSDCAKRKQRLAELEVLWISLAQEYPDATVDELVDFMNEKIQEDEVQNRSLEKKLGMDLL